MPNIPRIALTTGEPAGIGPDLAILLAQNAFPTTEIVVLGSAPLLQQRAEQLGLAIKITPFQSEKRVATQAGELRLLPVELSTKTNAGVLDPKNSHYVLEMLKIATSGCQCGDFDAMLTGPLHKGVINDAGIPFTGHTEYLANLCNRYPVMMLVADSLRVALATTHLPLSDVPQTITESLLKKVINILHADLQNTFSISHPRILVCGLNPHAGEGGHMGREEITVIEPAIKKAREQGINVQGPLPADTLFTPKHLDSADAVLAMYHDQGLPVLKYAGFGKAINITLGLSIIRTSVDHGTALDLAGTGKISTGSLNSALNLATELAQSSLGGASLTHFTMSFDT